MFGYTQLEHGFAKAKNGLNFFCPAEKMALLFFSTGPTLGTNWIHQQNECCDYIYATMMQFKHPIHFQHKAC